MEKCIQFQLIQTEYTARIGEYKTLFGHNPVTIGPACIQSGPAGAHSAMASASILFSREVPVLARHSAHRTGEGAFRAVCRFTAELLAVLAVLLGSYVGWKAWGSGLDVSYTSHREEKATRTVIHKATPGRVAAMRYTDPPVEAEPGNDELFAYIRVPSWSRQYRLPVWQGTAKTVLDKMGAGHYASTAMPGQVGNSSYAGHNTYADMADIRLLKPGDVVYIETADYWYRYKVNSNPEIVGQTRTDVIEPDAAGVERGLTLQTCWPIMTGGNVTHRMIVHGGFDGWAPKSDGVPAEYAETTDTTVDKVGRKVVSVADRLDMPVTGVLGLCALACWALLAAVGWLFSWRRAAAAFRGHGVGGPVTWLWRATPGLFASNQIVYTATRFIPYALLWIGIVLLFWRWGCPALDASPLAPLVMG